MKNYLVTIRIADGSNYETIISANDIMDAVTVTVNTLDFGTSLEYGEIICIVLSE